MDDLFEPEIAAKPLSANGVCAPAVVGFRDLTARIPEVMVTLCAPPHPQGPPFLACYGATPDQALDAILEKLALPAEALWPEPIGTAATAQDEKGGPTPPIALMTGTAHCARRLAVVERGFSLPVLNAALRLREIADRRRAADLEALS